MHLSPDDIIFWQLGGFKVNATIAYTWGLMLVLALGSHLVTRRLSKGLERSRWQNLLEIVVTGNDQRIMVTSLFDNLGKGASGAAVQAMNVHLGIEESLGLV